MRSVRLHPVAGLGRNQRRRHDRALDSQLDQLPVENVARRSGLIAGTQPLHRAQLLNQLEDRLFPVGDRSQAANLPIRLGCGNSKVRRQVAGEPGLPRNPEISRYLNFLKHLLDAAQCLTCPFFVLNQRKAYMAISVLPKANPWTDGNFGFGQQLF